jgi:hypothetical protein
MGTPRSPAALQAAFARRRHRISACAGIVRGDRVTGERVDQDGLGGRGSRVHPEHRRFVARRRGRRRRDDPHVIAVAIQGRERAEPGVDGQLQRAVARRIPDEEGGAQGLVSRLAPGAFSMSETILLAMLWWRVWRPPSTHAGDLDR